MIKRELYMERIRPFICKDVVKVLTGIRGSGKSVILESLRDQVGDGKHSIYLDLEKRRNLRFTFSDVLYDFVANMVGDSKEKWYLFFDEILGVADWAKVIYSLKMDFNVDIYLTGSNAKILSEEMDKLLSGKYVQFIIYPFSYREFSMLNGDECFADYLKFGGMPFVSHVIHNERAINLYLEEVFQSIVLNDVIMRNRIRDVALLEKMISYVFSNVGQTFSATSIAKYFKSQQRSVSTDTVLRYIKVCEGASLFHKLKRQDIKGKKMLETAEKYFVADHRLSEVVYGNRAEEMNQVLENIVCLELMRRGYTVTVGVIGSEEIDFIGVRNEKTIYVQVANVISDDIMEEQEFDSLLKIEDNYPKFVVSMDEVDMSREGIIHLHIKDFLLKEWEIE